MQALPCTIDLIEANPSLKADQGMGILVGRFNISYECFDKRWPQVGQPRSYK